MEWRLVQRVESEPTRESNRSDKPETEEERRRRIKGKAHISTIEDPRPMAAWSLNEPLMIRERETDSTDHNMMEQGPAPGKRQGERVE